MKNTVLWFNTFPSNDGVLSVHSPKYIMTGHEVAYRWHAFLAFGSYVQTHEEHSNNMNQQTVGAICLGPTGNR